MSRERWAVAYCESIFLALLAFTTSVVMALAVLADPVAAQTTTTVPSAVWDDGENVAISMSRLLFAMSIPALVGVVIAGVFFSAARSG